ncbi:MAG: hypothetical protein EOP85_02090 [Verrucomicrobiaceae bacterium]|nr:MAG: hypothetical protein EOP85_02090 [Verrucomicrobiaceae bacterium]
MNASFFGEHGMENLTHVDIRLTAKGLKNATYDAYERLLKPFTDAPRDNMHMNLEKSTIGDAVNCKVHVYGRCELNSGLCDAVFELVQRVPEVRIELSRGGQLARSNAATCRHGEARVYRPLIEEKLRGENFHVIMEGLTYGGGRTDDDQPKLALVG